MKRARSYAVERSRPARELERQVDIEIQETHPKVGLYSVAEESIVVVVVVVVSRNSKCSALKKSRCVPARVFDMWMHAKHMF